MRKKHKILMFLLLVLTPITFGSAAIDDNMGYTGGGGGASGSISSNTITAQYKGRYGIRMSFYLVDKGSYIKSGNTIDIWSSKQTPDKQSTICNEICKKEINYYHGLTENGYSSKLDYMTNPKVGYDTDNSKTLSASMTAYRENQRKYIYYVDGLNPDALKYADNESNFSEFRKHFTDANIIKKYAEIAGANIDIRKANYVILFEPVGFFGYTNSNKKIVYTDVKTGIYSVTERALARDGQVGHKNSGSYATNAYCVFPHFMHLVKANEELNLGIIPQSIKISNCGSNGSKGKNYSTYEIVKYLGMGIITGKEIVINTMENYKVVYHPIDLNNPFLNKDGTVRVLSEKSNWYNKQDTIDKEIYNKKPFLTVTLTPTTIKEIRNEKVNGKKIDYNNLSITTWNNFKQKYKDILIYNVVN